MHEHPAETEVVIGKLLNAMKSTVTAYSEGARKVEAELEKIGVQRFVNGTSFFPVGKGLWRGERPGGDVPFSFPQSPIMILGHNWGAVHELAVAHENETDGMNGNTWRILRRYLAVAGVCESDCFFTNVLVALQPDRSMGSMKAGREFPKQCRSFLCEQIEIVKPRLVATLGSYAADQYRRAKCAKPFVPLIHPSYVCRHFKAERHKDIIKQEADKLSKALFDLKRK